MRTETSWTPPNWALALFRGPRILWPMTHRVRSRLAQNVRPPAALEGDDTETYQTDASRYPGQVPAKVYLPSDEGQVAWVLLNEARVLTVGAQSSLTGGAAPQGDAVLATSRLNALGEISAGRVRAQPGVALVTLNEALAERGAFFPPTPTYDGAFLGGAVSTNAAGAATWKYGTTRAWVEGLSVVLASGEVLELERGQVTASPEGTFEVEQSTGEVLTLQLPSYVMPDVPKRSAGYHAAPGMDLVDLFIGAEGTLGVVTEVLLRTLEGNPESVAALVPCPSEAVGLQLVARLRSASRETWASKDPAGMDVRSVESMDQRAVEVVQEDGHDEAAGLSLPAGTELLLLILLELPPGARTAASSASWTSSKSTSSSTRASSRSPTTRRAKPSSSRFGRRSRSGSTTGSETPSAPTRGSTRSAAT